MAFENRFRSLLYLGTLHHVKTRYDAARRECVIVVLGAGTRVKRAAGKESWTGKDVGGRGRMAFSTALQNYPTKFLLGEHKTTASGCWPTPNL